LLDSLVSAIAVYATVLGHEYLLYEAWVKTFPVWMLRSKHAAGTGKAKLDAHIERFDAMGPCVFLMQFEGSYMCPLPLQVL